MLLCVQAREMWDAACNQLSSHPGPSTRISELFSYISFTLTHSHLSLSKHFLDTSLHFETPHGFLFEGRSQCWGTRSLSSLRITFHPCITSSPPFSHNLSQLLITHYPLDRLPSPPDQVDSGQRVVWRVGTKCTTVH